MPPKSGKKGAAKKASSAGLPKGGTKNWEAGLTNAPFEEDTWQACVCMVVGKSPVEEELINALILAKAQRKLFTFITRDSIPEKVNELGNPKKKKGGEAPMFIEVMEAAKAVLDAKEEISLALMANILKFLLLQIKANDCQRRKAEEAAKAEPVSAPNQEKGRPKSSGKKRKEATSPALPKEEKKKTKLKRRDYVEPPTYKDDEPADGPQHYVLLLGFCQPQLIKLLDAMGVHVANVIELCSEQRLTFEEQEEQECSEGKEESPKEEGPQEEGPKEEGPQEEGPKEEGPKEEGPKEEGPKEEGPKEEGQKEEGQKEEGQKEEGPKEEGQKEEGQKEEGPKEEGPKEEGQKEEGQKEEGPKEEGPKEEGPKEEGQKEEVPKEEGQKEEGPKEEGQKEEGPKEEGQKEEGPKEEGPKGSAVLDAESHHNEQLDAQARSLDLFWSLLKPLLDNAPFDSKLHDVVQISYTVSDVVFPFDTQEDPEAPLLLGSGIFDGVANLVYNTLNWRRQHQHYQSKVQLIDVPSVVRLGSLAALGHPKEGVQTLTPRSRHKSGRQESFAVEEHKKTIITVEVDMCYYSNLLDQVAPEAWSVALILNCMLEQVVVSSEEPVASSAPVAGDHTPHEEPGLHHQLVSSMFQSFLPLFHTEEERSSLLDNLLMAVHKEEDKKIVLEMFEENNPKKTCDKPLIFSHHDERALRLREVHVAKGFSPAEVEVSMMSLSPVWQLVQSVAQQKHNSSCWKALKQQLQHHCTNETVSLAAVERLVHLRVFEAMPVTTLEPGDLLPNGVEPPGTQDSMDSSQEQTQPAIPWDDPLVYAKQQVHNLQNKDLDPAFLTEHTGNAEPISKRVCTQLDLSDLERCRMRSLLEWHYTEHHNADIFPQVLQSASEEYLCMDTFRGSHNNILYILCHNPMSPRGRTNESWDVVLHTDVKFRKYLEHVTGTISDWTREEELKREAMLNKNAKTDEPPIVPEPEENPVVAEEPPLDPVIRKESLKAWKIEQDRLKEEELSGKGKKESAGKGKNQKQKQDAQSASNKKSKPDLEHKKSKSRTAKSTPVEPPPPTSDPVEENKEPEGTEEPSNFFGGYTMNGKLVQLSGRVQHLFLSDGSQITVETINFVEGSSQVKLALKKDGNHFYTHVNHVNHVIVNPAKPPQPATNTKSAAVDSKTAEPKDDLKGKREDETVEIKRIKQGSFTAVLNTGIHLSYSFYGPTGEYTTTSQLPGGIPEISPEPTPSCPSTGASRQSDMTDIQTQSRNTTPPESQEPEPQPESPASPFRSLTVSVPNGLLLQFMLDNTLGVSPEEQDILVRQSFPFHGAGDLKDSRDPSLSKELSRIITGQGAVIRCMRDGSTEVLFPNGSISFSQDSGPVWVPDSEVPPERTDEEAEVNKDQSTERHIHNEKISEREPVVQRGFWLTTTPSGDRICTVGNTHEHIPTPSLRTLKSTDPITHQVMLSREDLVVSVQSPDGSRVVEHPDGTRITSLLQNCPSRALLQQLLDTALAGEHRNSDTLILASQSSSSNNEFVTYCLDSVNDNVDSQRDTGDEMISDTAEDASEKESSPHASNDEQHSNAQKAAAESGNMSPHESKRGSSAVKETVVIVEKEGCATVVLYPARHATHVFFADGSVFTGNNLGEYQVFPSNAGLLQIQSDGQCVYSSDQVATPNPRCGTPHKPAGFYTMSHTEKVTCDITDLEGNHFQVMEDGQICAVESTFPSSSLQLDEDKEDREVTNLYENHTVHLPRLFLVHEDGSGTELLNSHTAEELLYQAYSDPTVTMLKEPVPDTQDEVGINILKASHQSVWSQWVLDKQNPDITPLNLRNRSWHDFPRVERKKPGLPFGIHIGRGLNVSSKADGLTIERQPVKSCPAVLEIRELYQYPPFTPPFKNTIDSSLKEYIEALMERENQHEEMKLKDPRPEEECTNACDLLNTVMSFAEEHKPCYGIPRRTSVEMASLYSWGVAGLAEQAAVPDDKATSDSLETIKCYIHGKDSKWTERLAGHRQELHEQKTCRRAIKKKKVVPYFHPENLQLYESLLQPQILNMRSAPRNLQTSVPHQMVRNKFPTKPDNAKSFLKDAPQESARRALNPTPSQSASCTGTIDETPEKRPTSPTPQSTGQSSENDSGRRCKSLHVDVTGRARKSKIRLPSSIFSSKPSSIPNEQFLRVEDPVRRRSRTASVADPTAFARGFLLFPSSVDFGTVQEGTSSVAIVVMRNVGIDPCRFHVNQPSSGTGLRVMYYPGPVAAGMQIELQVHLFAMCACKVCETESRKDISQDITISTETAILYLPVTAKVLSHLAEGPRPHTKKEKFWGFSAFCFVGKSRTDCRVIFPVPQEQY